MVNIFALAVSETGKVYVSGEQSLKPEGNSSYVAQWDGEKWAQINTNMLNTSLRLALDKSGRLYASGQLSTSGSYIVYWDGTDWITITDRLEGEAPAIFDMAVDANNHLYIGGSFESVSGIQARNIAYWDGGLWHALGAGVNKQVDALTFDPSGQLYVVGLFTEAGGLTVQHVARWDGETWHALER
jgi:trimeric autotransporter adhesin